VILNGVNLERFSPDAGRGRAIRAELGIAAQAPLVGTVAVFRRQKRLDRWLEVAHGLARRLSDCRFLIVGDGPLRPEVEARIEELELGSRVHLAGIREDVRPYLAAMDVFVSSSQFEGLPIALLEAMAMELPVVATAVGGVPEVVVAGETGALVPPGDVPRLESATFDLLCDQEARRRLGRAGRERIVAELSLERMVARQERLYEDVLDWRDGGG